MPSDLGSTYVAFFLGDIMFCTDWEGFGMCYVPTQLFLACTCVLFLVSPVAIFRTGFPFVEYCSGSFRPCLQSDY